MEGRSEAEKRGEQNSLFDSLRKGYVANLSSWLNYFVLGGIIEI